MSIGADPETRISGSMKMTSYGMGPRPGMACGTRDPGWGSGAERRGGRARHDGHGRHNAHTSSLRARPAVPVTGTTPIPRSVGTRGKGLQVWLRNGPAALYDLAPSCGRQARETPERREGEIYEVCKCVVMSSISEAALRKARSACEARHGNTPLWTRLLIHWKVFLGSRSK